MPPQIPNALAIQPATDQKWTLKHFDELTTLELFSILKLRQNVFMLEQASLYPDIDGADLSALHLFLVSDQYEAETQTPLPILAYGRILAPTQLKEDLASSQKISFGRVIIAKEARGTGLGTALIDQLMETIKMRFPHVSQIEIGAQAHLENFYGKFGFVKVTEPYDDGGVLHIDMHCRL
ncbi:MAG: GNAT family N-acetyltransferase [Xanthomonadaceae bacterium]|nr:GNAT family N-acetyltransferase [Xanthomonadaceae bacterium]